jgi:Nuclease-related domain
MRSWGSWLRFDPTDAVLPRTTNSSVHSRNPSRRAENLSVGKQRSGTPDRRAYERLHADSDTYVLRERRFIGSLILRLQDEPTRTRAWEQGASGERIVGARLDKIDGIEILRDRRIPGTRTNIDHIAIGPGGVYVVDARLHKGMAKHRRPGGFERDERRLLIGGHDQVKLVAKMSTQVSAITRALCETPIPVTAALCVVDAQAPLPTQPFMLDGVWIGWPDALPDLVGRPGLLDPEAMAETARRLDTRLPPT